MQHPVTCQTPLRADRPMPNRPEGRFDGIRRSQTRPMGGGKGIELQQLRPIFLQTRRGFGRALSNSTARLANFGWIPEFPSSMANSCFSPWIFMPITTNAHKRCVSTRTPQ